MKTNLVKRLVSMAATVVGLLCAWTTEGAEIRNVTAVQRYPWNGKVVISYEVDGTIPDNGYLSVKATDRASGRSWDAASLSGDTGRGEGPHRVVWDLDADGISVDSSRVVFSVSYGTTPVPCTVTFNANGGSVSPATRTVESGSAVGTLPTPTRFGYAFDGWFTTAIGGAPVTAATVVTGAVTYYAHWTESGTSVPSLYCVVDLSDGSNAVSYPVTYLDSEPSGGFNTDEYKTTKLVLRCIEAGTFIMGDDQTNESHRVTLTQPFYMGIFEVTQKQYELVTGSNPSQYTGDMRPVEKVTYNDIRGASNGTNWPSSSAVDSTSFLGKFRARTGLAFDLPTDAQWEYACRAGTTSKYNNGGDSEADMLLGRYSGNQSDGKGGYSTAHTTVGSYLPNAWGLYDMHGNVWEWCLDWAGTLTYGTDPKGPSPWSYRVRRGGGWLIDSDGCTSSDRGISSPSLEHYSIGFRLARTLSN